MKMIDRIANSIVNTIATNSILIILAWSVWVISTLVLHNLQLYLTTEVTTMIAAIIHFNMFLFISIPLLGTFILNLFWFGEKADKSHYYLAGGAILFILTLELLLFTAPTPALQLNGSVIKEFLTTDWVVDWWYVFLTLALFSLVYLSRVYYQLHKADRMIEYLEKIKTDDENRT